jgi:FAD/FMN-containing dehydrogenase
LQGLDDMSLLPFGNGRSYGDSCLNDGGALIDVRGLDRFIAFDPSTGILRCEAGVLLAEILELAVPQGWFVPATPGTQLATVGGAIANDVHGKAHHRDGTFGRHVRCFELLRSDGARLICSPTENCGCRARTIPACDRLSASHW